MPTLDFLNEKLGQYMAMYNDTVRGAHLDLVFFKDAMIHLVKVIAKILGYFRVTVNLIMKARLSAKHFICKLILFAYK